MIERTNKTQRERDANRKRRERKTKIEKKCPLTTIALATAGATNPGIEPMQFVRPRIVP